MGHPQLVAAGAGAVWVLIPPGGDATEALANQGALLRIDPDTGGRPVMGFRGLGDGSLAVGEGAVWITEPARASLTRYALGSGRVSVRRPFGAGLTPVLMAVGEGFVWVTLDGPHPALAKVDPHTMQVVRSIALASAGGVAVGAGRVWVTNRTPGTVTRIDARSGQPQVPPSGSATRPRASPCWPARPGSPTAALAA